MQISDTERLESSHAFGLLALVTGVGLGASSGHGQRADIRNNDEGADKVAPRGDFRSKLKTSLRFCIECHKINYLH
jgi:hypothetical protein